MRSGTGTASLPDPWAKPAGLPSGGEGDAGKRLDSLFVCLQSSPQDQPIMVRKDICQQGKWI